MQKARFYDRMVMLGTFFQVLFTGALIEVHKGDSRCSVGRLFLCKFDVSIRESKHLVNFL